LPSVRSLTFCGREQCLRLSGGQMRQETIEPGQKAVMGQEAPHAFGLDQGGRLKVVAARLTPGGAVDIFAIPAQRRLLQQPGQGLILYRGNIVSRHPQPEGGVEMRADPHWVSGKREEVAKALRKGLRERVQCLGPVQVIELRQFRGQLQKPAPAIGSLEAARHRGVEIGALRSNL
jgi:hypothetical protein